MKGTKTLLTLLALWSLFMLHNLAALHRVSLPQTEARTERGMILDRNGSVLAKSTDCVSAYAEPWRLRRLGATELDTLAQAMELGVEDLDRLIRRSLGKELIWLKRQFQPSLVQGEAIRNLAGGVVRLSSDTRREYPGGSLAGHVLGFGFSYYSQELPRICSPDTISQFILQIVGREMGLTGMVVVIGLFIFLAASLIRRLSRLNDPFRVNLGCAMALLAFLPAFVGMMRPVSGLICLPAYKISLLGYGPVDVLLPFIAIGMILGMEHRAPAGEVSEKPALHGQDACCQGALG